MPHSVLQQYEEKLRAPLMHTGPPQPSLSFESDNIDVFVCVLLF